MYTRGAATITIYAMYTITTARDRELSRHDSIEAARRAIMGTSNVIHYSAKARREYVPQARLESAPIPYMDSMPMPMESMEAEAETSGESIIDRGAESYA